MMKRNLLPLLVLLCIIIPVVHAANWQNVETFTGASTQDTDLFTVTATEWRIRWSYTPASGFAGDLAGFSVFVYPKGETALYVDAIIKMGRNETSGTTYIHQGQKEYYLKIGVVNLAASGYTITVEQDAETIPNPINPALVGAVILIAAVVAIALAVLLLKRRRKPKQPLPPPPS
jgi:hypothetical protein